MTPTSVQVSFTRARGRNHRQAVGQVAWTFPQSASSRSQNENRGRTSARARRGVVSANEKKEKRKKRNYSGAPEKLGKIVDWSKIILINFSPITNFFRLPSFSLCHQQHVRSRRLSCRSHPILDERKKRSTYSKASRVAPPPPLLSMCPCVMSPFLSLSAMPISLPD